ncbi:DUF4340 domain-containing protein [Pseudodesulfovibrio portus]|uniref:DUF4340 domain-containing protein n=1 Tax=Pseudodesulfovibrio portus TaxID=231439 RepID=A0ABM8ANC3_9BACT|nr:DUF4340 domain-containing protein [Pseudodesulfovibrio portus]BDQ32861.1 hypothetical protein JCM14722_04030 [Pseudodesulfovibrio portus]
MRRIVCIVAVLFLAGLAGGVYLYDTYSDTRVETSRWLSSSLDNVVSVHVLSPEGSYSLFAKGDTWKADVPGASWNVRAHVKPNRVREYISYLADLTPDKYIADVDQDGPESYGLNDPKFKVILNFTGKTDGQLVIKFTVGETGRVFGWNSRNPGMVYEFDGKTLERLALPALHFLDDYIFRFDEELVDRVQLVQPFGSSWLVEKGESGFIFKLPGYLKGKQASGSDLKLYVHSLALIRAKQLILEPVVIDKEMPTLTVRVWGKGGKNHSVEFFPYEDSPDVFMGVSSWLTMPFLVDAQSVAQMVKSAFDIQSRTVMALDIGTVDRVVIDHGEARFTVERSDTGWRLRGTENDIPGIDMSLWRITNLKFEALPLNNLSKTAVALMHCRLLDADGKLLKAMTFYADPELPQGQCWMKSEDGMYYPVSSRLLKDLQGMFPAIRSNKRQ